MNVNGVGFFLAGFLFVCLFFTGNMVKFHASLVNLRSDFELP